MPERMPEPKSQRSSVSFAITSRTDQYKPQNQNNFQNILATTTTTICRMSSIKLHTGVIPRRITQESSALAPAGYVEDEEAATGFWNFPCTQTRLRAVFCPLFAYCLRTNDSSSSTRLAPAPAPSTRSPPFWCRLLNALQQRRRPRLRRAFALAAASPSKTAPPRQRGP